MEFAYDARTEELRQTLLEFMDSHVYPAEEVYEEQLAQLDDKWAWDSAPIIGRPRRGTCIRLRGPSSLHRSHAPPCRCHRMSTPSAHSERGTLTPGQPATSSSKRRSPVAVTPQSRQPPRS